MRDTHPHTAVPSAHLRDLAHRMQARKERIAWLEHQLLVVEDEGTFAALDWQLSQARQGLADDEEAFDGLLTQVGRPEPEGPHDGR